MNDNTNLWKLVSFGIYSFPSKIEFKNTLFKKMELNKAKKSLNEPIDFDRYEGKCLKWWINSLDREHSFRFSIWLGCFIYIRLARLVWLAQRKSELSLGKSLPWIAMPKKQHLENYLIRWAELTQVRSKIYACKSEWAFTSDKFISAAFPWLAIFMLQFIYLKLIYC